MLTVKVRFVGILGYYKCVNKRVTFGDNYNQEIASQLFPAFAQGDFSAIPEVKILSDEVLGSTNGAYSAQKNEIYLNERFLTENADNSQAVATLFLFPTLNSLILQTKSDRLSHE